MELPMLSPRIAAQTFTNFFHPSCFCRRYWQENGQFVPAGDGSESHPFRMLLLSSNLGSLFEKMDLILDSYCAALKGALRKDKPDFIAVHFQELGGKKKKLDQLNTFMNAIRDAVAECGSFFTTGLLANTDVNTDFSALGSVYFASSQLWPLLDVWDFQKQTYTALQSYNRAGGDLQPYCEHVKFEGKSRKGFLHVKCRINGKEFSLVNIHNFHDENNLVSLLQHPSPYAIKRREALILTMQQLQTSRANACFLFGDFNFRLDLGALVGHLLPSAEKVDNSSKTPEGAISGEISFQVDGTNKLIIQPKKFSYRLDDRMQDVSFLKTLARFDSELPAINEALHQLQGGSQLLERQRDFAPTFQFEEDVNKYNDIRVTAWCDRILFTPPTEELLTTAPDARAISYRSVGCQQLMGDHKPVLLLWLLCGEDVDNAQSSEPVGETSPP